MTFVEYTQQEIPVKQSEVIITPEDCFQFNKSYDFRYKYQITLYIDGEYYFYVVKNNTFSNRLYTIDGDGNVKSMSCFVLKI
jgi:hypothetical protein